MGAQTRKIEKKSGPREKKGSSKTAPGPTGGFGFWMWVDRATDRFGTPGGVFVLLFGTVKLFANEQTENEVVREIFFRETTGKPYVQAFVAALLVLCVIDIRTIWRYVLSERRELKRRADEIARLQARLGVESGE